MTTYKAKDLDLQKLGLNDDLVISRNLSYQDLVLDIVNNGEGHIASSGAAMIDSGKYTGRSPKDKYIVEIITSELVNLILSLLAIGSLRVLRNHKRGTSINP